MDLVYGHLGVPVYDTESKKWHFARNPRSRRYIHSLGPLMKATETDPIASSDRGIRQLWRAYPEVEQNLLLELAQVSEAVIRTTSQYDPTVSDLLVVGSAVDSTTPKSWHQTQYKPTVAVASGAAGEVVKLVVLNKQHLGWETDKDLQLKTFTARSDQEGWWKGNGSKIQQLIFAGREKEASSWLAVRYQGAISILKPLIRAGMVCPSNARGQINDLPASRVDANHLKTLASADACGVPFADVAFNPWNSQQFVTVDQGGHWHIWSLEVVIKNQGLWNLVKDLSGSIIEDDILDLDTPKSISDGWARTLWACDSDTLVVASRTTFAIFDIKAKPVGRIVADLGLAKYSDWIIDVKSSPACRSHLLVLTSSRLFLLEIRPSRERSTPVDAAVILISWIHFRAHQDFSLSFSILDGNMQREVPQIEDTITVVLYSRLNDLASIFTFQHSKIRGHAMSTFDPCLFPLNETTPLVPNHRTSRNERQHKKAPLYLQLNSVTVINTCTLEHPEAFNKQISFYLLRTLDHNFSLSEQLYVDSSLRRRTLQPPDIQKLTEPKKTPAKVEDDFIVPDGAPNDSLPSNPGEAKPQRMALPSSNALFEHTGPRTLEMDWLVDETNEEMDSMALPLEGYIALTQHAVIKKSGSVTPGAETLLELSGADPLITDIDDAATAMTSLVETIVESPRNVSDREETVSESWSTVSTTLLPQMCDAWNFNREIQLSQIYETLVESQIRPLPLNIPSRVRVVKDKQLRAVAAQIFLAAHVVSVHFKATSLNQANVEDPSTQDSLFALPVRRKDSDAYMSIKGRPAATQSYSSLQPSSTPSQRLSSQVLAGTSNSSKSIQEHPKDPSSIHLRTLISPTPQPHLPPKLSNILSHWRLGDDPATYDWEAAQRATGFPDSEAMDAEDVGLEKHAKKSKKRARINAGIDKVDKMHVPAERKTSSQPEPKRRLETRSQVPAVASSQVPESSQIGTVISSQPLAGRLAGGQKVKKGKKKGF